MNEWKKSTVSLETPIDKTIARVNKSGLQLAMVLDGDGKLAGVLTDGDIRKAILGGISLATPVSQVMTKNPMTVPVSASRSEMISLMRRHSIHHLPLLAEDGLVAGLVTLEGLLGGVERPNTVVLMAGGRGTRLMPLTERCPKPLLEVGGKPILEISIERLAEQGFRKVFISVNYMADMICNHFQNGERWGIDIQYLQESDPLGTAGALSLLPDRPDAPIAVMNGDLITNINLDSMLQYHTHHGALATMAVREYDIKVPFGVVKIDGQHIKSIDEKPVHSFFVNAGIYVLSPEALDYVPADTMFNMTTLFETLNQQGNHTSAFPLREHWMDIGQIDELERARRELDGDAGN